MKRKFLFVHSLKGKVSDENRLENILSSEGKTFPIFQKAFCVARFSSWIRLLSHLSLRECLNQLKKLFPTSKKCKIFMKILNRMSDYLINPRHSLRSLRFQIDRSRQLLSNLLSFTSYPFNHETITEKAK